MVSFPWSKTFSWVFIIKGENQKSIADDLPMKTLAENQHAPGSSPGGLRGVVCCLSSTEERIPLASVILGPDSLGTKRVLSPGSLSGAQYPLLSVVGAMSGAESVHDGLDTSVFLNWTESLQCSDVAFSFLFFFPLIMYPRSSFLWCCSCEHSMARRRYQAYLFCIVPIITCVHGPIICHLSMHHQ